jgi:hypothetical protein
VVDREALAWAAGFYDGEGYAGTIVRGDGSRAAPRFSISITQYELSTLTRFHAAVGGLGLLYTQVTPAPSGRYRSSWSAQSFEAAQAVVCLLWGWLSLPKQTQIVDALTTFHALRREHGPFRNSGPRRAGG